MNAISVIVPTLNEVDNIGMLVSRIAAGFANTGIQYEIVFVDDHSTDGTATAIANMAGDFPVRCLLKKGERGKAYSLLEGFAAAEYDILCMIDADLQYPPEAILPMYRLMQTTKTDIVLTNRQDHATSRLRKVTSSGFNFVFTKMLFGFDYDSQSGLKLFKRKVIDSVTLTPTPWSFDLEFIVRSLEQDYKIVSYDITFAERYAGVAKIQVSKVAIELAKASVKLRFSSSPRKVKEAYKTNIRNLQGVMTVGLLAVAAGSILAFGNSAPASALSDPATGLNGIPTLPVSAEPDTYIQPVNNQPSPAPAPAPAPVSAPAAAGATTAPAAPAITYPTPVKPNPKVTPVTASAATAQPNTAGNIRYPALTKQPTAAFSYPDRRPNRAAAYIRPLGFVALATVVIGGVGYGIASLASKFRIKNYQSQS